MNLSELENGDLQKLTDQLEGGRALLPTGHLIGQAEILFAKIHDRKDTSRFDIIEQQKAKLAGIRAEEEASKGIPIKAEITYDDFIKLDIRTGKIIAAEKMEKADKLLKLKSRYRLRRKNGGFWNCKIFQTRRCNRTGSFIAGKFSSAQTSRRRISRDDPNG